MTCIVGYVENDTVYMGGDSASVSGWDIREAERKVFHRGPFLIGYTDSFRMGQLLERSLDVRPQEDDEDDMEFMVNVFVEAVRILLREKAYTTIKDNEESTGRFLVGYRGNLYRISGDFHVAKYLSSFDALGCGASFAIGAMESFTNHHQGGNACPREMIASSLEIAGKYSAGVCGPYYVVIEQKGGE